MFLSCKQQLYHQPIFSFWHPGAFPRDEEEGREEAASGGILHGADAAPTHFEGMRPREEGEGLGSFPGAAEISRSQGEAGQRAAVLQTSVVSHAATVFMEIRSEKSGLNFMSHDGVNASVTLAFLSVALWVVCRLFAGFYSISSNTHTLPVKSSTNAVITQSIFKR